MFIQAERLLRAGVVAIAPVILLALSVTTRTCLACSRTLMRWLRRSRPTRRAGGVHLASGVASAVLAVAFLAIRSHLHELGEVRWSAAALPFVVIYPIGSSLRKPQ